MDVPLSSEAILQNTKSIVPSQERKAFIMKNSVKTLAMLTLSACVVTGGAISSFAAAPVTSGSAAVIAHQTSTCGDDDHANAEILARFKNADGSTSFYTICAEDGEVNGEAALTKLTSASSNFYGTQVYTGTLDNGERIMTATCISGNGAMTNISADVRIPNSDIKGYDLYLVGSDGTETKLNVSSSSNSNYSVVRVNMQDGAALIRLVPQSNC